MTPFEYLSVLISIVIGLAITQLLSGTARLIQVRARVRPHATTLLWMATLFLLDTQIWWAAFERRDISEWNFFLFLFYLLQPTLAFLLSYLVLPELGDEDEIDLPANFAGNRPWFFALLALVAGRVRNARAQLWFAGSSLALLCGYVGLLFLHLS
jgi:hypothetical protein